MATPRKQRLPAWLRRGALAPGPVVPSPPPTDVYRQIIAQRAALVAQGQEMATHRATLRILGDLVPTLPPDGALLPRIADGMAGLQETVAAFDRMWHDGQEALGLPALPELSAADEADLRARILSQVQTPAAAQGS